MKCTITEARARWNKHTRHVITDEAARLVKRATWTLDADGNPALAILGEGTLFVFFKDARDHVWSQSMMHRLTKSQVALDTALADAYRSGRACLKELQ